MFVRLPNVPNVEHNLPVGSRLNPFWEPWKPWGLYPRPNLTRSPKKKKKKKKIHQLMDKMQSSQFKISGLLQLTFLGSKTTTILGLDKPSLSETIRTSLQQGEWVTSVDFNDAYFHIPMQEQSRKYLRFHTQGQAYQFKALPFRLPTAPMEFTVIPKEVKLMAIHKG